MNNGTCNSNNSNYSCTCSSLHYGNNCEFKNTTTITELVSNITQSITNITSQNVTNAQVNQIAESLTSLGNSTNSSEMKTISASLNNFVSKCYYLFR